MPPKSKFTRQQITETALKIVRDEGFEKLTARALGQKLGSSSCPIFTVFENMDEVKNSVFESARGCYREYVEKGLEDTPAFKGVGIQYILFSVEEPELFRLLFMCEHTDVPSVGSVLPIIEESYDKILSSIISEYKVSDKAAEKLYRHLWIYTHGIAVLCATKMCRFTGEEISGMMTEVFISLLKKIMDEDL